MSQISKQHRAQTALSWLGEIPSGWEVRRLKTVCKINPTKKQLNPDQKVVFLPMEMVSEDGIINQEIRIETEKLTTGFTYFERNDVIFAKITPCFENGKGALLNNLDSEYGFGSTEFHVLRAKNDLTENQYLSFIVSSQSFREIGESFMEGAAGQKRITTDFVKNFPIALPPLPTQKAIANFLDQKTASIAKFIEDKKKLIKLLKEQKQAIIHQAVTKGIEKGIKMKDSGIAWLGEIPENWEVKRLRFIVKKKLEYGANEATESNDVRNPRYIRITDFDDNGSLRDGTFCSLPMEKAKDYLLKDGDILFARSGATVGKTFIFTKYDGLACFAGYLIRATVNKDVIGEKFLYLFTKSKAYEEWKNSIFSESTIQNIGADKYNNLFVPLPPISVQEAILLYIEQESRQIDTAIAKIEQEIALIEEYKKSLIYHAVTGKITI